MFARQIAIVPDGSVDVSGSELSRVGAALQKQVARDFAPIWRRRASVDAFPSLEDVPLGYWPVVIVRDVRNAAGVHLDNNGQPFALVEFGPDWSLTASHETLEMLADPFGSRLVAGQSPKRGQGRVEFLVEVCDPCEAGEYAYSVNGLLVSDFYTPHFLDPVSAGAVRYSFTGAITAPRRVLPGGYLSWLEPVSGEWWQLQYFGEKRFVSLGRLAMEDPRPPREFVNEKTPEPLAALRRGVQRTDELKELLQEGTATDQRRAKAEGLRSHIRRLTS